MSIPKPKLHVIRTLTACLNSPRTVNSFRSMGSDVKRSVLVVEDQSAICELVSELIQSHRRYNFIGSASDGENAIELALRLKPDILVLDVVMPRVGGIEVLRRLGGSLPAMKVLIFSGKQEPHIVRALMQAGIHGFVHKTDPLSDFRKAVDALANGQPWFSENFDRTVREALATPVNHADSMLDQLTPREREISVLIAKSYSSKEVAGQLQISIKTAENHRANLMRKLGVRDVAGLVRFVIRQGLVDPSGDAA